MRKVRGKMQLGSRAGQRGGGSCAGVWKVCEDISRTVPLIINNRSISDPPPYTKQLTARLGPSPLPGGRVPCARKELYSRPILER